MQYFLYGKEWNIFKKRGIHYMLIFHVAMYRATFWVRLFFFSEEFLLEYICKRSVEGS